MRHLLLAILLLAGLACFSQNTGINTNNPGYPLDVNGWTRLRYSGTAAALLFNKQDNSAPASALAQYRDSILGLANLSDNVYKFFFNINSVRFGIGNSTPNAPLSFPALLGRKITLYPGASGDVGFGVQGNLLQIFSDHAGADIGFGYGSSENFTERMRVKGNGTVGVGTYSPIGKMTIAHYSTVASPTLTLFDSAQGFSRLQFQNGGGNKFWHVAGYLDNLSDANSRLNFYHSVAGDVMSLTGDGKVGIGTSNPSAKLSVNGSVKITDGTQGTGKVLTSDANGNASWQPKSVGFRAVLPANSNAVPGTTVLSGFTENYDDGNNFNPGAGIFTAPADGVYHFEAHANFFGVASGNNVPVTARLNVTSSINGTLYAQTSTIVPSVSGYGFSVVHTDNLKLLAGDQVQFAIYNGFTSSLTMIGGVTSSGVVTFSGYKVY